MWNKIQRIYIGTQKVRPLETYTYSYDFTTGNQSEFTSQWWSFPTGCSITSNGLSSTSSRSALDVTIYPWIYDALQTAKKVHVEMTRQKTWSTDSSPHSFGIAPWGAWIYWDWYTNRVSVGGTNYLNSQQAIANGTYLLTNDVDLVNKTVTWSVPWYFSGSATVADTDIENVRTATGMSIRVSSYSRIKDIKLVITY